MKTNTMRTTLLSVASLLITASVAAATLPPAGPVPPPATRQLAHDLLKEMVQVRSVHAVGTRAVADILVRYLKAGGFSDADLRVLPEEAYPAQVNLVVRLRGKGKAKPILWHGHLDVVEAIPKDWSLPPFQLTEKDGYFYGRGTTDMKDEDAAMAAALIRLKLEGFVPDRDIIVAFTADEEVGNEQDGMWYLLREHRALVDAQIAINPDDTSGEIENGRRLDFKVETSEKTYATFTLATANRGGHSSEPRADNAIYQLANGLVRLSHYEFPFKISPTMRSYFAKAALAQTGQMRADMQALAAPEPDLAAVRRVAVEPTFNALVHSTCVATMLAGGQQENALAQSATATVQCRLMPDETMAAAKAAIEAAVADPGITVTPLGTVTGGGESPPTPHLMAAVEQVVHSMWPGIMVLPYMSDGSSDSLYTRQAGIPSYVIGGGWSDIHDIRMHGRDERDEIGNFYSSIEFTYRLMKELSQAN
jgi:acetylornithine deacetylase/succinyl-diaminopimelate desuccinylase-like protein